MEHSDFASVVFAGGGSRCAWQVGFWEELSPFLKNGPRAVGAVSAGAAMACFVFAGRAPEAMDYFQKITAKNPKNFYPENLFNGVPLFPHLEMYRNTLLAAFDEQALKTLHRGPDVRILLSRPPAWAKPGLAVLLGFLCYQIEKSLSAPLHPTLAIKIGFRPEIVSIRSCETPEMLAALILASSCTPPFTPVLRWNGAVALDGGLIDNVPYRAVAHIGGRTLFLLTRSYRPHSLPSVREHAYIQPSRPIAISKWDYTNPEGLLETYELGKQDARRFLQSPRTSGF